VHGQSLTQPLYKQGRAINEDDGKLFVFARLDVGYTLSGNPLRNLSMSRNNLRSGSVSSEPF